MKRSVVILIVLWLATTGLMAQNDQTTYFIDRINVLSADSRIDVNAKGDTVLISEYMSRNVKNQSRQDLVKIYKGTPFFKNRWFMGEIRLKDGQVVKGNMAYNVVANVVYFSVSSQQEAVEIKPEEIILGGYRLTKQKDVFENARDFYYETIYNEKSVLFSQPVCRYVPKVSGPSTGYEATGDNFEGYYEKSEKLYLGTGEELTLIRANARFYDLFGQRKKEIRQFVADNNLRLKSRGDIIRIFRYYDSLQ